MNKRFTLTVSRYRVQATIAAFLLFSTAFSQSLDELAIEVSGISREFAYTNKETAFLYGETNSANKTSWQGFNVFGIEFLDDYEIWVDEKKLDRASALKTIVYPDYLKRTYKNGIVEEVRLADSLAVFSVTITAPKPIHIDVVPYFSDGQSADQYDIRLKSELALVARTSHLERATNQPASPPLWLALHGSGFLPQLKSDKKGLQFSPIMMIAQRTKSHTIVFSVANTLEEAEVAAKTYLARKEHYHEKRRARMEKLLHETRVETDNKQFNKALAWAKLSLDALIMNQITKGIFAGLPWFNNYWGRDTFISLLGATLVQGRFTEAKQILQSFAAYQQLDGNSTDYGRIPNIITTTDKAYNTADGTPRFVMMARDYVERSGDSTFMLEIYPTILRSIEGTLKYHCDSLGFLTHGDAETWMDAVGPDGPWSPRGNRANDIQALWAKQLEAGIWFASRIGDVTSAALWNSQLQKLKKNFPHYFFYKGGIADHVNKDGTPDDQLRPNQIFVSPLLDESMRAEVLLSVTNNLTYEYGVASLSQNDENFHPYHQYSPYYPKDAAYHNGTVWTWVQGPVISELCAFNKQELAWRISRNTIHQILNRGAVGTQSELLDAIARPKEKEPRLSGTFSQAWNLAEVIRNFYDDYLGIRVDMLRHHLTLRPKLPAALGSIRATINLNGRAVPIEVLQRDDSTLVQIDGRNFRRGGTAEINLPRKGNEEISSRFLLPPNSTSRYVVKGSGVSLEINEVKATDITTTYSKRLIPESLAKLNLATPKLKSGLRALKGPDHPLLTNSQVKLSNPKAKQIVNAHDPEGDDLGTGAYDYPKNSAFVPGSFDLTGFSCSVDEKNAYFRLSFRALSNPGWHPEYGFQLTYAAIAIDQDGVKDSGKRLVEQNANYVLDERHAYEKLILVGGGVRLEDDKEKILAEYRPAEADVANPLGDMKTGTISFAIPLKYFGTPTRDWTFTVLVGAQDDHGGAGLGEFRTV
ncbi:MAG: hypothetical protein KF749_17330, partial [Bacteroidetes bacterium]|nr:hypothetical protein [Bacteroidota bacterium]